MAVATETSTMTAGGGGDTTTASVEGSLTKRPGGTPRRCLGGDCTMTAAMAVAWRWRRGEGGGDGRGAAMAAAMTAMAARRERAAQAARAKPEHTSCPDQAAPGCPDVRVHPAAPTFRVHPAAQTLGYTRLPRRQGTPGCPNQLGCVHGGVGLEMGY